MSGPTWFLNLGGAMARVFTTMSDPSISEESRPFLLAGFVIGASLSFIILAQIVWYRSATNAALAKDKKTK